VGVHRVDQVASRKAPVPGPLPSPDEILEIRARPRPSASRRVVRRPERWLRSLRRLPHTRRGRWTLISLACVAVLLVGLLAEGFLSSAAPSAGVAGGGYGSNSLTPRAPQPSASKSKGHGNTPGSGPVSDPVAALRLRFPDNPLNHLRGAGLHQVSVSVSGGQVFVLGYLIPTGMGSTYGQVKGHPRSWSMSERAIGPGYLAALFVQASKDGEPVTCHITVDGKSTDTETTSGSYGRAICLG
jgi:hypothetical protein